ncbi:zinc finger protein ZAT5-like [Amaranthus tricolor]|uniref:zinc finger protein ZAT5-like n=1 Tax=Amaranthus tricolor TaxID=29722 RepID=UPI0025868E1B|nr:zinc finger protein ZAT5-like [Amaranthus tricolor]
MVAQQQQQHILTNNTCINHNTIMMIKGKRTKRSRTLSPFSLTMSSTTITTATTTADEPAYSNSATSEELAAPSSVTAISDDEDEDMAHCLILLAQGSTTTTSVTATATTTSKNAQNDVITTYECKTCNKSFSSFQALGGHRASHKKPKLTPPSSVAFALDHHHQQHNNHRDNRHQNQQFNNQDCTTLSLQIQTPLLNINNNNNNNPNNKITKVHECSICGAEFSSGQALGGHMRRHRPIGTTKIYENTTATTTTTTTTRNLLPLDLNLPAPDDHDEEQQQQQRDSLSSKFVFPSNEKTLVFSASSQLVDCHY